MVLLSILVPFANVTISKLVAVPEALLLAQSIPLFVVYWYVLIGKPPSSLGVKVTVSLLLAALAPEETGLEGFVCGVIITVEVAAPLHTSPFTKFTALILTGYPTPFFNKVIPVLK